MSVLVDSLKKISQNFTHKDGVYCFIGPESYEVDDAAMHCAMQMKGIYTSVKLSKLSYLHNQISFPLFGQDSKLSDRKMIIELCMAKGHPAIAVYTPPDENMTFPDGVDKAKALRAAKKIAKPTPVEGWTQIYRYTPSTGMVLVWDALTGKKSDKLLWEKE